MRPRTWAPGSIAVVDYVVRQLGPVVTAYAKLVYLHLFSRVGEEFTCYPSISTIAVGLGIKDRAVKARLKELEGVGLVRREWRNGTSTLYHLSPPWITEAPPPFDAPPSSDAPRPEYTHPNWVRSRVSRMQPKQEVPPASGAPKDTQFEKPNKETQQETQVMLQHNDAKENGCAVPRTQKSQGRQPLSYEATLATWAKVCQLLPAAFPQGVHRSAPYLEGSKLRLAVDTDPERDALVKWEPEITTAWRAVTGNEVTVQVEKAG